MTPLSVNEVPQSRQWTTSWMSAHNNGRRLAEKELSAWTRTREPGSPLLVSRSERHTQEELNNQSIPSTSVCPSLCSPITFSTSSAKGGGLTGGPPPVFVCVRILFIAADFKSFHFFFVFHHTVGHTASIYIRRNPCPYCLFLLVRDGCL